MPPVSPACVGPARSAGGEAGEGAMAWLDPLAPPSVLLLWMQLADPAVAASKTLLCQGITVPTCRGVSYNLTYLPS